MLFENQPLTACGGTHLHNAEKVIENCLFTGKNTNLYYLFWLYLTQFDIVLNFTKTPCFIYFKIANRLGDWSSTLLTKILILVGWCYSISHCVQIVRV
jgi:hypothetical protein